MPRRDARERYRRQPPPEDPSKGNTRRQRPFKSTVATRRRVGNLTAQAPPSPGMLQKSSRIDAQVRFLVPEAAFEPFLPFVIAVRFVVYIDAQRCGRWDRDWSQRPFMSTA
jgi:hypothetical protein